MKVHGKDAVSQYDSEDSDDEASSPSSSIPGHTPVPPPHQIQGQEWYCHAQSLPTPPSDHTSPGHHSSVKFENHHSIGGIIGNQGYWTRTWSRFWFLHWRCILNLNLVLVLISEIYPEPEPDPSSGAHTGDVFWILSWLLEIYPETEPDPGSGFYILEMRSEPNPDLGSGFHTRYISWTVTWSWLGFSDWRYILNQNLNQSNQRRSDFLLFSKPVNLSVN